MQRYPVPAAVADAPHCTETEVRRSRFLARSARAESVEAARAFIESVRRQHPDATHNCWAFAAGAPGDTARVGSSDDGEPHGTAGRPMLQVLLHSGVGEICTVVTRWFGGVKLGTGGLVRAYQEAVLGNLDTLPLTERVDLARAALSLDYAHVEPLRRLLPALEARIVAEEWGPRALFTVELPDAHLTALERAVADVSKGTALVRVVRVLGRDDAAPGASR